MKKIFLLIQYMICLSLLTNLNSASTVAAGSIQSFLNRGGEVILTLEDDGYNVYLWYQQSMLYYTKSTLIDAMMAADNIDLSRLNRLPEALGQQIDTKTPSFQNRESLFSLQCFLKNGGIRFSRSKNGNGISAYKINEDGQVGQKPVRSGANFNAVLGQLLGCETDGTSKASFCKCVWVSMLLMLRLNGDYLENRISFEY